jgi:uncharacterized protein YndB with AHSA1/START domain
MTSQLRGTEKIAATSRVDLERDPRSIIGTRDFDAPRALVFSAWTDPKHLAQWWGPFGFTTTTFSFDFRPGGVWRFVMHGPDGCDYQNRITFEEIVPPQRIVYRHGGGDDVEPVQFRQTVIFEELGAVRASPGAASSHQRRNAIASSRITVPTKAWPRRSPGLAIMWQRQLKHDPKNDTTISQTLNGLFSRTSD